VERRGEEVIDSGWLRQALVRIACSLLGAGLFYAAWMILFLLTSGSAGPFIQAILWLLAPVMTAAGFALGVTLVDRFAGHGRTAFLRIFPWPLIGCAVGAGIVYWFGPMLIVFAMFAAGTAGIALRELHLLRRSAGPTE
jgi:hypothetical protein